MSGAQARSSAPGSQARRTCWQCEQAKSTGVPVGLRCRSSGCTSGARRALRAWCPSRVP
jgi:hypothetical protein